MAMDTETSTIGEQIKWRGPPRKPTSSRADPNPHIPSIIQSTRCKSTISSLLLSTFTNNNPEKLQNSTTQIPKTNSDRKKCLKNSSLRGFGCTAQPEVTVPAMIRSSAHWEESKETRKKKKKQKPKKSQHHLQQQQHLHGQLREESSVFGSVGVQDLWCGPGFGSDAAADCVVSARPLSGRGKIDVNKGHPRERPSYCSRQRVNTEQFASLDMDSVFEIPHFGLDVIEDRFHHHLRNQSPEGLAEIMFQNGLLMGRRSTGLDRYWDWRLDVDNMTYEELLELGERIGYVSTGLREDQIGRCIRKTKFSVVDELSESQTSMEVKGKCSICQEEYEAEDELGKLECRHAYHLHCIKQWLAQKNACPVCKVEATSQ